MSEGGTKIIACRVVVEEMLAILPPGVETEILEMSLHENPRGLRDALQASIDASAGNWETILLGYGLCGQAVVGLHANGCRLVIPRADDCIGIFLGSREAHRAQARNEPGTYFLTKGWIGSGITTPFREYDRLTERWGKERADRVMRAMLRHYTRLALIRTGDQEGLESDRSQARAIAGRFGLRYEELDGTNAMVEQLLYGPWDDSFVVVPPGGTVAFSDFLGNGRPQSEQREAS